MICSKKLTTLLFCIFIGNTLLLGMKTPIEQVITATHSNPATPSHSSARCPLNSNILAYISQGNTVKILDLTRQTHKCIYKYSALKYQILSIAWTPDGELIIITSRDEPYNITKVSFIN